MAETNLSQEILVRARKVKLLLMDCDGVLTDGRLYFSEKGEELKVFHVRDGQGLVMWHEAGFRSGVITGRKSKMLERRVENLGIHYLKQSSENKIKDFEGILRDANLKAEDVAYVGDDLPDVELLSLVGFPVVVADSVRGVRPHAQYITQQNGGNGAIREVTDLLLKSKDLRFKK